jgi:hypothetical protein
MRLIYLLCCIFIHTEFSFASRCSEEKKSLRQNFLSKYSQRFMPKISSIKVIKKRNKYVKKSGSLALRIGKEEKIKVPYLFYKSLLKKKGKKSPLIFLFTGVYGVSLLERYIANYFVKKGISVVVSEFKGLEYLSDPNSIKKYLNYSIRSSLALSDYFLNLSDIDSTKTATIGVSLGGFRALYMTSFDQRIKAATLVVTGDSLRKSMVLSELDIAKKIRKVHMDQLNLDSFDEYNYFLKKYFPITPLELICSRTSDEFFLVMAEKDKIVPTSIQNDLWKGLGYPLFKKVNLNHRRTVVYYALSYLDNTRRFFQQIWGK